MATSTKKKVSVTKESKSKTVKKAVSKSPAKTLKTVSKQPVKKVLAKTKSSGAKTVPKKKIEAKKGVVSQNVRLSRILNPSDFEKTLAKKGMNMADLGSKLGVSRQYISAIANGRSPLSESRAKEITGLLGIKLTDMFQKKENNYYQIKK